MYLPKEIGSYKRMMGVLKYNPPKDEEKAAACKHALALYQSLTTPTARKRFLYEFDKQNHGRVNCMKFATTFQKRLKYSDFVTPTAGGQLQTHTLVQ